MHAKTDSEVTSLAPSSPPRSPPRTGNGPTPSSGGVMRGAVYYVQSPSRDSHDGETTTKAATTPALSPMASPRHSHSSSSRFSRGGKAPRNKGGKGWQEIGVIEEEGLLDEDERRPMPKRCKYCLIFVGGFAVLFTFFALVLWGAARSQKPQIAMKSITFENFIIQAGTDASLVPTDMATTNSTVKFTYKNTGTFFGMDGRRGRRRRGQRWQTATALCHHLISRCLSRVPTLPISSGGKPLQSGGGRNGAAGAEVAGARAAQPSTAGKVRRWRR